MKKAISLILIINVVTGVLSPIFVYGIENHVVINEVVYDPEGTDLGYEWIELYNPTQSGINLAGWKIQAGGSSFQDVITISSENPIILNPESFYLIGEQEVSGANLNVERLAFQNGGSETDGIRILDSSGVVIDTLLYDEPNANNLPDDSGNPGINFAIDVASGASLGRDGLGTDTNDSGLDFKEYTSPTPGAANESIEPPENYSNDIIINEFLPDPEGTDSDGEFIELKNIGSSAQDLEGWMISDASETTYIIDSQDFNSTTIEAGGFLVIDREISGIALNNSGGDQVELYQPNGILLQEVAYDSASEDESYSRQVNGNYKWTTTSTPGAENIFTTQNLAPVAQAGSNKQVAVGQEVQFDGSDSYDPNVDLLDYNWDFGDGVKASSITVTHSFSSPGNYVVTLTVSDGLLEDSDSLTITVQNSPVIPGDFSGNIIINEVLPNPEGSDTEGEFMELKNIGNDSVDLSGWQLGDSSSTRYVISSDDFSSTMIKKDEFFVIEREISGIALNNTGGDQVILYNPNEEEVFSLIYSGSAPEGSSYGLLASGEWKWTTPTPGEDNLLTINNDPPIAKIEVVSEAKVGEEITLDASDSSDPDGDELTYQWDFGDGDKAEGIETTHSYNKTGNYSVTLTVIDSNQAEAKATAVILISDYDYPAKILINELMINVVGLDNKGEWIEIINLEEREVNLRGWQIADLKDYYLFSEDTLLAPHAYLLISREDSGITLNNLEDTVYLINPRGEIVNGVSYQDAQEDISWARLDFSQDWFWTGTPTPGLVNEIKEVKPESNQDNDESVKVKGETITTGSILEIKKEEKGNLVQVQGWVTVEPGILGSQIFYLQSKESGIQIFSSKKDFPELNLGDYLQVTGKLSEARGEKKINITTSEDIQILELKENIPTPHVITNEEIGESLEGTLVTIEGKVVDKKGDSFFLDYGGPSEAKVTVKSTTDIKKPILEDSQLVRVTGIVSQSGDKYQILPRYQEDIVLPAVLGESQVSEQVTEIPPVSESKQITKYLLVLSVAIIIISAGLLIKKYGLVERIANGGSKK